ncbi:MAG TPA: hypothetical protein VGK29_07035 [Paludibaculum sp.]|jgi:hypothetical protein
MPIIAKRITGAVGRGGSNFFVDVKIIKYLLNTVPEEEGGPRGAVLEGTPLNELIGHIEVFQRKALGVSDGRVDVEGRTLRQLREFDPTPNDPPFVPTTISGKKRVGKKGGQPSAVAGKQIGGAVGRGGSNNLNDVEVVEYLLNTVPVGDGGPVDVILKRTTLDELIVHIERFQRRKFGFGDGRVDVGGRTLQRLREFDPTPDDPPFVPQSPSGRKGGR